MNYKLKLISCIAAFLLAATCVCLPVMAGQTDALPLNDPNETVSNDLNSSVEAISVASIVSDVVDSGTYSQSVSDVYSSETPSVDSGITSSDGFSSSSDLIGDSDNISSEPMSSDVSSDPTVSDTYSSELIESTTTSYYDPDYTYSYDYSYNYGDDYEHYISLYSNVSMEAHSTINSENWSDVFLDETNSKEMEKLINAGQKGDFSFIKNRKDTGAGSAWYWLVGGIALIVLGTVGLIYSIRSTMKARAGAVNTSGARNTKTSRARSAQKRASSHGDTAEIRLPKNNRR